MELTSSAVFLGGDSSKTIPLPQTQNKPDKCSYTLKQVSTVIVVHAQQL